MERLNTSLKNESDMAVSSNGGVANPKGRQQKGKSPADAFIELRETVNAMRMELLEIKGYSAGLLELSEDVKAHHYSKGLLTGVESLCRIHLMMTRQFLEKDGISENDKKLFLFPLRSKREKAENGFLSCLYEVVEEELRQLGVRVLLPSLGEKPDYTVMKVIGSLVPPEDQTSDCGTIAAVKSYGYLFQRGSMKSVLKKAEIFVYSDAEEDSGD